MKLTFWQIITISVLFGTWPPISFLALAYYLDWFEDQEDEE